MLNFNMCLVIYSPHSHPSSVLKDLVVRVSLPREWFQEIKRMMMVHSTHGLFLTCTQESHLYLHTVQLIDIHAMYRQLLLNPLQKIIKNPDLLEGPLSCS